MSYRPKRKPERPGRARVVTKRPLLVFAGIPSNLWEQIERSLKDRVKAEADANLPPQDRPLPFDWVGVGWHGGDYRYSDGLGRQKLTTLLLRVAAKTVTPSAWSDPKSPLPNEIIFVYAPSADAEDAFFAISRFAYFTLPIELTCKPEPNEETRLAIEAIIRESTTRNGEIRKIINALRDLYMRKSPLLLPPVNFRLEEGRLSGAFDSHLRQDGEIERWRALHHELNTMIGRYAEANRTREGKKRPGWHLIDFRAFDYAVDFTAQHGQPSPTATDSPAVEEVRQRLSGFYRFGLLVSEAVNVGGHAYRGHFDVQRTIGEAFRRGDIFDSWLPTGAWLPDWSADQHAYINMGQNDHIREAEPVKE